MKKFLIFMLCIVVLVGVVACTKKEEAPKVEDPKVEAPKEEAPKEEVPKPEEPKPELEPSKHGELPAFEGATMTVKEDSITKNGVKVELANKSDKNNITYGEQFILEKKVDGKWYLVPVTLKGEYGFKEIGYELKPGESNEVAVEWEWLHGSVEPGEYRILKDVIYYEKIENQTQHTIAAEFTVK